MLFRLIFCTLLLSSLFGETMFERLSELCQDDLVVYSLPRSICIVAVEKREGDTLFFRTVTATKDVSQREGYQTWIEWFDEGASEASTDERFSVQNQTITKLDGSDQHNWFLTLLSLELSPVPNHLRKKAGPKPMAGEHDLRPIWQPKVVVNGFRFNTPSVALETKWPTDSTALSERPLTLYFPTSKERVHAFPYYIESPTSSYRVEVIDSRIASTNRE
jgi:hypothetical protein